MPKRYCIAGWELAIEIIIELDKPGYIIYYDKEIGKGLYYDQKTEVQIEFEDVLTVQEHAWETAVQSLTRTSRIW